MQHLIPTTFVIIVCFAAAMAGVSSLNPREQRMSMWAFLAHVVASFVHVWIIVYVYGGGDSGLYLGEGLELVQALNISFSSVAPEILKLIFQVDYPMLPATVEGVGSSTGTMAGLSAFLLYFLNSSIYAVSVLISTFAFFGTLAIYRVFRDLLPREQHERLMYGTMLMPSLAFWSSTLVKEAFAVGAVGWMMRGFHHFTQRRYAWAAVQLGLGGYFVVLVKPYVVVAFVVGATAWFITFRRNAMGRSNDRLFSPGRIFAALIGMMVIFPLLGAFFPVFDVNAAVDEAARLQNVGQTVEGGSNYDLGNAGATGFFGQMFYAPLALISAWFRPFIFEVRSVLMLLSAAETTVILVMTVQIVRRRGLTGSLREIAATPVLLFAFVLAAVLGVGVGLSTTNLGSLARYRMPLLPFLAPLVFVLRPLPAAKRKAQASATSPPSSLAVTPPRAAARA